jgi:outer membrane receptor for ferrienterochelin and colicins
LNERIVIFAALMKNTSFFFLLIIFPFMPVFSQSADAPDSLRTQQLDEVVVTATRNERTVGALPMPVTLVKKEMIKSMGSVRLNDVLTEQTGLVVVPQVNGQGNGIQVQGFDPDYTLILVDGEPIVGRYTGSLELSRLSVGNIKQIEIVKGPSSSLYGSDALAGVINIITERPTHNQGEISLRMGAVAAKGDYFDLSDSKTTDVNASGSIVQKKLGISLYGNTRISEGYDLSPLNFGKTVSPFINYTIGSRATYQFGKTDVNLGLRYFSERQNYGFEVLSNGISVKTKGEGTINDWSINPVITHRFNSNLKVTARVYFTGYGTNTVLKRSDDEVVTYRDYFNQTFTRYELNGEYFFSDKNVSTIGAGYIPESVTTSRYNDRTRQQQTDYIFFQHEFIPFSELTVIGGIRYDRNSVYGDQYSPKLSARYQLNKKIVIKSSFGQGFKTPDFRQLYYDFSNEAGGGYIVLGTEVLKEKFDDFIAQGVVLPGAVDITRFPTLKPERSWSFNFGADFQLSRQLNFSGNLFYNNVDNLIDYREVAKTTQNKVIYSFFNITHAILKGLETDLNYKVSTRVSLSIGYQLLYAINQKSIDQIEGGTVFRRDPITFDTRRLNTSEYFGLYNRSRHTGNLKLFYKDSNRGLEASLRMTYRGKFGIRGIDGNIQGQAAPTSDVNGNEVLDDYDRFASGYAIINFSVAKTIKGVRFQAGIDNLFGYTDPIYLPNIPGRSTYISIGYTLTKKTN